MRKYFKYLPLSVLPYFIILISLVLHFKLIEINGKFLKGTLRGFLSIVVLLFQF